MPHASVRGIDLYHEERGAGSPVLLIHGLGSSARDWSAQIESLAARHRVIAVDLRGHGRSSRTGPFSVAGFAADLAALLATLRAPPVHAVGISLGAGVALQLALDAPAAVRSLTVVNGGPDGFTRSLAHRRLVWTRVALTRLFGPGLLGRLIAAQILPGPALAAQRATMTARWADNDPASYNASLRALVGWSVRARLGELRCPCLVIAAEHDHTPVAYKEGYVRLIAGARLAVIPDSRHFTTADQPEAFGRVLAGFLADLERGEQRAADG